MKIQKKKIFFFGGWGSGSGWGVRVDVNEELKIQKKKFWGGGLGGGSGWM